MSASDPLQRRVASIFIDESGARNSAGGAFVLGFLKTYQPSLLWRSIRDIRQRYHEHGEIKFASITSKNIRFYFDIVEEIANSPHIARVGGSVYHSVAGFAVGAETWREQAKMSRKLIVGNTNRLDHVICFLDLVQTPRGTTVAALVKDDANRRLNGSPVLEAYDVDSKAHDLVQLADLVAGAVHYERSLDPSRKSKVQTSPKFKVMSRLRRALELDSFDDIQQGKVNILTMVAGTSPRGHASEDAIAKTVENLDPRQDESL